jgi:hypothetical protein
MLYSESLTPENWLGNPLQTHPNPLMIMKDPKTAVPIALKFLLKKNPAMSPTTVPRTTAMMDAYNSRLKVLVSMSTTIPPETADKNFTVNLLASK